MFLSVNYIAVVVAAVLAMVVGYVWYAEFLFGKSWMKYVGQGNGKSMTQSLAIMFAGALITAYVLSYFLRVVGATSVVEGFVVALWAWVGLVVMTSLGDTLFGKKPWSIFWLQNFHQLVSLLVMSAVLVLWM